MAKKNYFKLSFLDNFELTFENVAIFNKTSWKGIIIIVCLCVLIIF